MIYFTSYNIEILTIKRTIILVKQIQICRNFFKLIIVFNNVDCFTEMCSYTNNSFMNKIILIFLILSTN